MSRKTRPSVGREGSNANRVSSPPLPDLYWNATQDDKVTPSPQSEVSFWAHMSSLETYCRHYGKEIDGPVPKWRLRSLYSNAPTTFSGPTPPTRPKKRRCPEEFSPASARASPAKQRGLSKDPKEFSPTSSPCE